MEGVAMPIWVVPAGLAVVAATAALTWWLRRYDEEK
jgi:hypothetical protein